MALTNAEAARIAAIEARADALEDATARLLDGVGQLARHLFGAGNPDTLRANGCAELADLIVADRERSRSTRTYSALGEA